MQHLTEISGTAAAMGESILQRDSNLADQEFSAGPLVRVVGLWRRLLAALIDLVCLSPALILAAWLALRASGVIAAGRPWRPEVLLELALFGGVPFYGAVAVMLAVGLLYVFLFVAAAGRTPGLRVVGAKVINSYGETPELWRAGLRCVGLIAGTALIALGLLWIGVDREKRGLHDWLAGTYVILSDGRSPR